MNTLTPFVYRGTSYSTPPPPPQLYQWTKILVTSSHHAICRTGIHLEYCEDLRDSMKNNLITWIQGDEWYKKKMRQK